MPSLPKIKESGASVIVVEQDIGQALKVADRVYCMMEGRVTLDWSATDDDQPRRNPRSLFRSEPPHDLGRHHRTGRILLGGLYALFAAGLSAGFRHHAAGEPRPWRSDRARPLILILVVVSATGAQSGPCRAMVAAPVMFGIGWVLAERLF